MGFFDSFFKSKEAKAYYRKAKLFNQADFGTVDQKMFDDVNAHRAELIAEKIQLQAKVAKYEKALGKIMNNDHRSSDGIIATRALKEKGA